MNGKKSKLISNTDNETTDSQYVHFSLCHTVTDLWTSVVCREDRRYVSCACGQVLCVEKTDVMYLVPVDKCCV